MDGWDLHFQVIIDYVTSPASKLLKVARHLIYKDLEDEKEKKRIADEKLNDLYEEEFAQIYKDLEHEK